MIHDDLIPAAERPRFERAYVQLAGGVRACLNTVYWALEGFEQIARDSGGTHHAIPAFLCYDFIEAVDGICLLAERGSAQNCDVLLRMAYEVQLSIIYITQSPADYRLRSLAYEYFHLANGLKVAERADPTTDLGRQLHAEMAGDPHAGVMDFTGHPDVDIASVVALRRSLVASDRFAEVREELDRMRTAKRKAKDWYALWGGPTDLRQLATRTTGLVRYEALYRQWSGMAHGSSSVSRLNPSQPGTTHITAVRSPAGLTWRCLLATNLANTLCLHLTRTFLSHRLEEYREKHLKNVERARSSILAVKISG